MCAALKVAIIPAVLQVLCVLSKAINAGIQNHPKPTFGQNQ